MIKSFKQLSLILLSTFLFTACSIKEPTAIIPKTDDLTELSKTANDDFLNQKRIFVPSLGVNGKKHKAIARSKEKLINVLDEAYDRDLSHMLSIN